MDPLSLLKYYLQFSFILPDVICMVRGSVFPHLNYLGVSAPLLLPLPLAGKLPFYFILFFLDIVCCPLLVYSVGVSPVGSEVPFYKVE